VFISWSRTESERVGQALHEWLPMVVHSPRYFLSMEDIEKGARWNNELIQELRASHFGILCITPENVGAPWLNFEAGALSMAFPVSRVSPFLVGVSKTEVTGPLTQFQMTAYEKGDVKRLVHSINASVEEDAVGREVIDEVFEAFWPRLEAHIDPILENISSINPPQPRPETDVLEEVLELVRDSARLLSSPGTLLPRSYLANILTEAIPGRFEANHSLEDLLATYHIARRIAIHIDVTGSEDEPEINLAQVKELCTAVRRMRGPLDALLRRSGYVSEREREREDAALSEYLKDDGKAE
jgi:hypothetical protein